MSNYISENQLPFKFTQAGVIPINTVFFDWDVQDFTCPGLALQVVSIGTTGVLTPEFSSDEVNWVAGYVEPVGPTVLAQATITAAGLYQVPRLARFIRLRLTTATTAGATTLAVTKSFADFRAATLTVAPAGSTTVGQAAHDAAVAGNPVRTAGRALTANYTAVATGDTADFITTLNGAQITKAFSIPDLDWQYAAAAGGIVNTTDVVARTAGAAGIRNYVTGVQVRNTNAVATEFVIKDGATVIWRTQLPASMTASQDVVFATPLRGTAAAALNIACITTGAAVYANLQGYQAS